MPPCWPTCAPARAAIRSVWIAALEGAGNFDKPALAVAWRRAQGMGGVTAQVLVRHWQPATPAPTVGSVPGPQGADLFHILSARPGLPVQGLRIGVCKGYVTSGTGLQFAVAVPARDAQGIRLGLVGPSPGPAPPTGGSARFRLLPDVPDAAATATATAHLHAAATDSAPLAYASDRATFMSLTR